MVKNCVEVGINMHDYAIFNHNRISVGRWLGVISIIVSGGIAQLLSSLYSWTGIEAFTKASISTAAIYFLLHFLVNKFIWKKFLDIPNLEGVWKVEGKTLNEDSSVKYNWNAEISIEQTWEQIAIHLKTDKSKSYSYTATIQKVNGAGTWLLSYSYGNEPNLEQCHELNAHKGYCQIEFDSKLKTAKASYFNSNTRRTFGIMDLNKEVEND